jgi:hypothetical protein
MEDPTRNNAFLSARLLACFSDPGRPQFGKDHRSHDGQLTGPAAPNPFHEELNFLSESDKDEVMGRAIVQRLKWT